MRRWFMHGKKWPRRGSRSTLNPIWSPGFFSHAGRPAPSLPGRRFEGGRGAGPPFDGPANNPYVPLFQKL